MIIELFENLNERMVNNQYFMGILFKKMLKNYRTVFICLLLIQLMLFLVQYKMFEEKNRFQNRFRFERSFKTVNRNKEILSAKVKELIKPELNEQPDENEEWNLDMCNYKVDELNDTSLLNEFNQDILELDKIEANVNKTIKLLPGGLFIASENSKCVSTRNVAIIVPYRNRLSHLKIFLNNMHIFLSKQKINYGIYVIEQYGRDLFNRGLLLNIGFIEAIRDQFMNYPFLNYDCFIFHDIDFIPASNKNLYKCDNQYPVHLSSSPKQRKNWQLDLYWGGAYAITKEQYIKMNGHSNFFFGWGEEDVEFYNRAMFHFGNYLKIPYDIGDYNNPYSNHSRDKENQHVRLRMFLAQRLNTTNTSEGLTTVKYERMYAKRTNLYVHIRVKFEKTVYYQDQLYQSFSRFLKKFFHINVLKKQIEPNERNLTKNLLKVKNFNNENVLIGKNKINIPKKTTRKTRQQI